MTVPVFPEVLLRRPDAPPELPLASEGVQRFLWESHFGPILIEVTADGMFVNGGRVEPFLPVQLAGVRQGA